MGASKSLRILFLHNLEESVGPVPSRLKAIAACYGIQLLLPSYEGGAGSARTLARNAKAVLAIVDTVVQAPRVIDGVGSCQSLPTLVLVNKALPMSTRQEISLLLEVPTTEFERSTFSGLDFRVTSAPPPHIERVLVGLACTLLALLSLGQSDLEA